MMAEDILESARILPLFMLT